MNTFGSNMFLSSKIMNFKDVLGCFFKLFIFTW
jgi:hypothetical protein